MLLTLSATSLRSLLAKGKSGKPRMDLMELPEYARQVLGLHGVTLTTELLAGASRARMEQLRERADKAAAAILLLFEAEPQAMGAADEAVAAGAVDRLGRVIEAGHILGCNAVALRLSGRDDAETLSRTADRLRKAVRRAERLEINVLIAPTDGLTSQPERVTDLIKKVGGFRVGTYPDFQAAAASADPATYLRRLTPYAAVICASTVKFTVDKAEPEPLPPAEPDDADARPLSAPAKPPKHSPYALEPLLSSIAAVGYDGTLAIEYRGTGDPTVGVKRTRQALEGLLRLDEGLP
ncbi:MAG: TIM barrel protein [Phycisphaerales bacterium]|nr:TIM barrel protein [Phycisphaerales bacterium]